MKRDEAIIVRRFFSLCVLAMLVVGPEGRAAIPVLREGRVLLPVRVADDAAPEERAAARELARVLGRMAGTVWPVEPVRSGEAGLHVGRSAAAAEPEPAPRLAEDFLAPKTGEWGPDAFRIRSRSGSLFVEAATPEVTGQAVAWFLQQLAGARWYFPGMHGEVIPRRPDWTLPEIDVTVRPAYFSRGISGLETAQGKAWASRNGLRERFDYSHALHEVFADEARSSRPEWLPILRGNRIAPEAADARSWQPDLSRPEVAAFAATRAAAAFAADPARWSYSLGMNDTLRFDQGAGTQAAVAPLRYFRGMPDYSPLVFAFMNRAAAAVAPAHPGRYLGCLAYFWCENVPPFPVHPQVLPYVTTDRSQYYDPAYRSADLALMSRWQASGVRAYGLWEYAYGHGFIVPRIAFAPLADSIREGWRRGARGYFAEVQPHAGFDAFKIWLIARLLWDPETPWQELAEDFFPGYYGAAAAPMRAFFADCEAQWMGQGGEPFWLKLHQHEDQALIFPPEVCRKLRVRLAEASALADSPGVAARVEQTALAFAVTEAYVHFDIIRRELAARADGTLDFADGLRRLVLAERRLRDELQRASAGETPAMTGVTLDPLLANDSVPRLLWLAGGADRNAPRRVLAAAGAEAASVRRWHGLAEVIASGSLGTARDLVVNGSFQALDERGLQPAFLYPKANSIPAGWEWRSVATEHGSINVVNAPEIRNGRAVRIAGAWDAQLYQWLPATPGTVYVATALMRGRSSPGGDASLFLTFLSAAGEVVGVHRMQSLPKGITGEWRTMVLADLAPKTAAWVGIGFGASRQVTDDWFETGAVTLQGAASETVLP